MRKESTPARARSAASKLARSAPRGEAVAAPRTRVRRSPEESRARILEAAIRTFSRQGTEVVGLKEVAAEAGVSHALVVHYFGSYDALVDVTVQESAARLRKRMIEHIRTAKDLGPESLMQIYFDAVLEPWYGRLVSWALLNDHEGSHSRAAKLAPEIKLIADATHNMLKERGLGYTRAQSETFMVALWSLAIGYAAGNGFFWRALGRASGPQRDGELRAALGQLVRGLLQRP